MFCATWNFGCGRGADFGGAGDVKASSPPSPSLLKTTRINGDHRRLENQEFRHITTGDDGQEQEAPQSQRSSFMNSIWTKYDYISELLEDTILQTPQSQIDLIVCSAKEDFVSQVLAELHQHHLEDGDDQDETVDPASNHILLSRSLHVLSASQHINLIFCPTITVLRGYLSGFGHNLTKSSPALGPIVILNLLAMHHGTSEFTLQGLSQTFATAVSAAHRTGRALKLVECKDVSDPSNPHRGTALWHAEVQLLSAAIKLGDAGQSWGRRTISTMRIASRWFEVEERGQHSRLLEEEMLV
jgi:hypothetical protein